MFSPWTVIYRSILPVFGSQASTGELAWVQFQAWDHSVWSVHVVHVSVWVLSGFLPQSPKHACEVNWRL